MVALRRGRPRTASPPVAGPARTAAEVEAAVERHWDAITEVVLPWFEADQRHAWIPRAADVRGTIRAVLMARALRGPVTGQYLDLVVDEAREWSVIDALYQHLPWDHDVAHPRARQYAAWRWIVRGEPAASIECDEGDLLAALDLVSKPARQRPGLVIAACRVCGAEYHPLAVRARTCSNICSWTYQVLRARALRRAVNPGYEIQCPACGRWHVESRPGYLYCSPSCRRVVLAARQQRRHLARTIDRIEAVTCSECGEVGVSRLGALTCSLTCSRARDLRRKRERHAEVHGPTDWSERRCSECGAWYTPVQANQIRCGSDDCRRAARARRWRERRG